MHVSAATNDKIRNLIDASTDTYAVHCFYKLSVPLKEAFLILNETLGDKNLKITQFIYQIFFSGNIFETL